MPPRGRTVSASVRFALDVSSPLAPELLEAFIGAAERHGHSVFGFIEGDTLQLVASDEISQAEVVEVLLSQATAPAAFFREWGPWLIPAFVLALAAFVLFIEA